MKVLTQISDCHIDDTKYSAAYQNLAKVIQKINQNQTDAVLITGDLSANGSVKSYQLLQQQLTLLKTKPFIIAGNHDNKQNLSRLFGQNLTPNFKLANWEIITIDSTQNAKTSGFLSQSALSKLSQSLVNSTAKYNIIALHHPPVKMLGGWDNALSLENPDDFFTTIAPYSKIKAVLWGHAHQAANFKRTELQLFCCPSSAYQFNAETKIGYNQYQLFGDGSLLHQTQWI